MRSVARSNSDCPDVLDPAGGTGATETQDNIDEFLLALQAGRDPKFSFNAYRHRSIKTALHRMFHGKCAYCETRYVAAAPMDVEHYRPKSVVEAWDGEPKKRGYFWLAARWENLLPSCADCNRRREQYDLETGDKGPTLGKRAIFPVLDEANRWSSHTVTAHAEQPILLCPCDDPVEGFLAFDDTGFAFPAAGLSADDRRRVEGSILIYGLNRPGLVLERVAVVRLLQHKMAAIDRVVEILDAAVAGSAVAALAEDFLQYLLTDLREYQLQQQPYSLMAEQVTTQFLDSLT